jgi:hypothetical protein
VTAASLNMICSIVGSMKQMPPMTADERENDAPVKLVDSASLVHGAIRSLVKKTGPPPKRTGGAMASNDQ